MLIDKVGTGSDATIVLFPQSYNKRGDERLHSVQGVTLDGRGVNVKLRVDEAMLGKENTPSISEFAREDVKAKNPCLATPHNGPDAREGVLLFTGCEEDGENRKGILSYTARWAYVLASHSEAPEPVFGLGRVVMIADSHAAKSIHSEITELEKTKSPGWEAIAEHKRKALSDPMLFSYYGHLYMTSEESSFDPMDRDRITDFAKDAFARHTKNGVVGGLLIRTKNHNGEIVSGFSPEVFPRWKPGGSYQSADDVLGFFFRANSKNISPDSCSTIEIMPIKRYSCGPSFKNYYFLKKPEDSLLKLRKRFLINNEPTVSNIAFALSRKEESGESFLLKYYPLSNPICSVSDMGRPQVTQAEHPLLSSHFDNTDHKVRAPVGLSEYANTLLPSWYELGSLAIIIDSQRSVPHDSPDENYLPEVASSTPEKSTDDDTANNGGTGYDQASQLYDTTQPSDVSDPVDTVDGDLEEDDLSALFSGITDEELAEIDEQQKLALAERAKADLIIEQEMASKDIQEGNVISPETDEPDGENDPSSGIYFPVQDSRAPATPKQGSFMLVDDSAEKGNVNQPVLDDNALHSSGADEAAGQPSGLERMLKMRGLL